MTRFSGKQTVDLTPPPLRVSRIRRDPPPKVKEISLEERNERDRRAAVIGIILFALSLFVIALGFSRAAGWSLSDYTLHIRM